MREFSISVVIRTYNSSKRLDTVLSNLHLSDGDELIVVDSGSTDTTLAIAKKYEARIIIADGPFNYSKSLNIGFRAAQNPWVLVLSSHCIPAVPDFVEIYRREIARFDPDVAVGYCPATITGKSISKPDTVKPTYFSKDDFQINRGVGGNSNAIYRRSAWEQWPFDETIRGSEDLLWIAGIVEWGHRYCYIPQACGRNKYGAPVSYMFHKGFNDGRAVRQPNHKPMKMRHLMGALKKLLKHWIFREIDFGDLARGSAHVTGYFVGTYKDQYNKVEGEQHTK